jgi:hypothetical protein
MSLDDPASIIKIPMRTRALDVRSRRFTVARMRIAAGAVEDGVLAPSTNVLGSYFPSWMLCALGAVAVTVAVRKVFVLVGLDRSLPAPFLVYLAMVVACSLGGWLLWLG